MGFLSKVHKVIAGGSHYHVTSQENAKSILTKGFFDKHSAVTNEYISLIDEDILDELLSSKGVDVEDMYSEGEDWTDAWVKYYGKGTIMFTSPEPLMDYGNAVLEFTPPKDIIFLDSSLHGTMWYYPKAIPSSCFRLKDN
jgi:hypothetical protein